MASSVLEKMFCLFCFFSSFFFFIYVFNNFVLFYELISLFTFFFILKGTWKDGVKTCHNSVSCFFSVEQAERDPHKRVGMLSCVSVSEECIEE